MAQGQNEKLSYAQAITEVNVSKLKPKVQRENQDIVNSVEVMLRQILNNQEIFERRLINFENKVKMLLDLKNG